MTTQLVADTNIVSYIHKGDSRAESYLSTMDGREVVISFMTVAELNRWAIERRWGRTRREKLDELIGQFVVAYVDIYMFMLWAEIMARARRRGTPVQTADAWIAATAISFELPLLTNDRNDFAGIDDLILIS